MTEYSHCPVCGTAPWNGNDGAYGVCPSCQEKEAVVVLDGPDPEEDPTSSDPDEY